MRLALADGPAISALAKDVAFRSEFDKIGGENFATVVFGKMTRIISGRFAGTVELMPKEHVICVLDELQRLSRTSEEDALIFDSDPGSSD